MGKQTRAKFLMTMSALSLAALAGCAGGAPPDSTFQGTYQSTYALPAIGENGLFSFTVEQKGRMVGSFTDANTNTVYAIDGVVENNGRFTGSVRNGATTSTISGLLVTEAGASTTPGGNFTLNRGGTALQGSFVIGGSLSQTNSDYQGIYSGVYNIPGLTLSGLASYTVDSKGNITGSMTRGNETGLLSGVIGNTGAFTATIRFSNVVYPLAGSLVKTIDNSAQGNFTANGTQFPGSFSKSESVQAGGDSPFKGAYRGTYGVPERGESGNISFTVDPSGTIQGFFSQSNSSPVAAFTGSFQNDGTFSGTLSYPVGSPAPYNLPRPIIGKMGNAQAGNSGAWAGDFTLTIGGVNIPGNFQASIGGSEIDSIYRGSYKRSNAPEVSGFTILSGSVIGAIDDDGDLTVDKQGEFIGVLAGLHFTGRFTNDGRVVGTLGTYAITGKVARQNIVILDPADPTKRTTAGGIVGNLQLTLAGVTSALVNFTVVGGSSEGSSPR